MAALPVEMVTERPMKRNSEEANRKLFVGEKVEVRSIDEGFGGSWHSATIIACNDSVRHVRYEHLLLDDRSDRLTELIRVSPMIEGVVPEGGTPINYRGMIRPIPPPFKIPQWSLHFGLCVDALVNDAWWEGVIFDHEDGSEERLVLFPDLGDQHLIKIDQLRITQDWNEVSECWKNRGNWLFLELIEEHEQDWLLPVSVRQIWYDLRAKEAFQKRIMEWTCLVRSMWDDLVIEVISENLYLTAEHVLNVIKSDNGVNSAMRRRINTSNSKLSLPSGVVLGGQVEETQPTLILAEPDQNCSPKHEANSTKSQSKRRKISASTEVVLGGQVEETQPTLILADPDQNCSSKHEAESTKSQSKRRKISASTEVVLGGQVEETKPTLILAQPDQNCSSKHEAESTKSYSIRRKIGASTEVVLGGQVEETKPTLILAQPAQNSSSKHEPDSTKSQSKRRKISASTEVVLGGQVEETQPTLVLAQPAQNGSSKNDADSTKWQSKRKKFNASTEVVLGGQVEETKPTLILAQPAQNGSSKNDADSTKWQSKRKKFNVSTEVVLGAQVKETMPTLILAQPAQNGNSKHEPDSTKSQSKIRKISASTEVVLGGRVEECTTSQHILHYEKNQPNLNMDCCALVPIMNLGSSDDLLREDGACCTNKLFDYSCELKDISLANLEELLSNEPQTISVLPSESDSFACINADTTNDCGSRYDLMCNESRSKSKCSALKRKRAWLPADPDILPGAEYCPDALVNYLRIAKDGKSRLRESSVRGSAALKARMHLSHLGWRIEFNNDTILKVRYIPPKGKAEYSLFKVCQDLTQTTGKVQNCQKKLVDVPGELLDSRVQPVHLSEILEQNQGCEGGGSTPCGDASPPCVETLSLDLSEMQVASMEPEYCPQAVIDLHELGSGGKKLHDHNGFLKELRLKAKKHLLAMGWRLWKTKKSMRWRLWKTKKPEIRYELRYTSPKGRCYISLQTACKGYMEEEGFSQGMGSMKGMIPSEESKGLLIPTRVLQSTKRARRVVVPRRAHYTPRTVLSWLIDNNVVLPRARVHYMGRKDHLPMAEGRITRGGIRCSCCTKVFGLTSFEAHAGSSYLRPAANIFLEDGRSLLECQKQMVQDIKVKSFAAESPDRIKGNQPCNKNDYMCSVCHYGGTLVLCDQCPSSFHLSCLGLEDLPEGKWFCPSCRCAICGQSEIDGNVEQFTEKTVLCCDQCRREYHMGCIRKTGLVKLERCPKGNWFCSIKCEKIFVGLHKLLGKSIPAGVDNLSWTILKSSKDDYYNLDAFDIDTMTEHHSKLNVALGVMHECFNPIKEPSTKRDLFSDVLFNKWSELNRLNYRGFYTVLLEREDELISVATVRVYGEKVAEVPLVGTRVQFRRRGMCRILMNVLEKKLTELGVERLLLPAVPQVVHAWTTSFGFSKMTNSERLKFLEYTFLDFQDTTMCQKILRMSSTTKLTETRGNQYKLGDELNQSDENIDLDRYSIVSEVIQTEQIEQSEIVEQIPVDVAAGNGCHSIETSPHVVAKQVTDPKSNQESSEMGIDGKCLIRSSDERKEDRCLGNGYGKYYRQRISAIES